MKFSDCDKIFEKIKSTTEPEIITSGFHKLFDFYPLLNYQIGRGKIFWRGQKSDTEGFPAADRLHCPPIDNASVGRLNNAGEPCLYAATRITTVFREMEAKEGDYIHIVGLRMQPEKSIRIIAIGDMFHVHKTGYTRSLGRDPNGSLSRMQNNMDKELVTKILYVDAFLSELLEDKAAKENDYIKTRILASAAYKKSGAVGMFYPSVQDYIGMNLSVLSEAYFSNMHMVCSKVVKINKVHSYGFYDYEIIKSCESIDELNRFVWTSKPSVQHEILFNCTQEEVDFASSKKDDPNGMLDLMSFANS